MARQPAQHRAEDAASKGALSGPSAGARTTAPARTPQPNEMAPQPPAQAPAQAPAQTPTPAPDQAPDGPVTFESVIQTAVDHLDVGFSVYDQDLRLVAWNDQFLEMLDLPKERFAYRGADFADFIRYNAARGEYGPGAVAELVAERVRLAKSFVSHSFVRTRPDGTVVEIRGNPLPGGGFVTIYKDITERARAEAALKESHDLLETRVAERTAELEAMNERLRQEMAERKHAIEELRESKEWVRLFADTVPVVISYVDTDQRYRFANKGYDQWFGLKPEDIIGRTVRDVLGEDLYQGHARYMSAALKGETAAREFSLWLPDGRKIRAVASFIPHLDDRGQVQGYFVLGQDVTEQRRAEQALRQAQKMEAIGQLTGGLAHDFNNLLTIIMGNLAVLREQTDADADLAELIDPALTAARRGANLVKRMLSFARRQPLQPKRIDAGRRVTEMTKLLERALGPYVDMDIRLHARPVTVLADPHQLENAVLNLAINARDAMPDGGRLEIRTGRAALEDVPDAPPHLTAAHYLALSVADTGQGMAPEVMERAFEPFFSTKAKGGGTGLGLSMVYGFAQQSGGHVHIESAPGVGTRVVVYLPMATDDAVAEEPPPDDSEVPTGSEQVMVVEDDDAVRAFTAKALRSLGYAVSEAADAQAALAILDPDAPPDLLLTDVEMPGGQSGIDLARAFHARLPDTRVLFMSGFPDKALARAADLKQALDRPMDLLTKPFEKPELARRVRAALDT